MGDQTAIGWTEHTYNPWWGCTKVSPGCDHCYAEAFDKRVGGSHWGPHAERRRIGAVTLSAPHKWNRAAEKAAKRARVFCASMADVFDNAVPTEWRDELWATIRATPWLQWQLLTKRPQNIAQMVPPDWGHGFFNVWLGTTVENQEEADRRIHHLLAVPATVHFLSCEPLLGTVDLTKVKNPHGWGSVLEPAEIHGLVGNCIGATPAVDWVIIGGESGHRARPMHSEWARSLMDQCREAEVPVWFKQVGTGWQPDHGWGGKVTGKGHDPAQWPAEFRVQEMPT